ncbi:hypothetical protein SLE2022_194450 [Rubroshorea leprosula]
MAVNWGEYGSLWSVSSFNWDLENTHFRVNGKPESKSFGEVVGDDILEKLPEDPFGMEIRSTFAALGFVPDFGEDWGSDICGFGMQDAGEKSVFQPMIHSINWVYNSTKGFDPDDSYNQYNIFDELGTDDESIIVDSVLDDKAERLQEAGPPHDAMFLALGYLGVRDLLAVERVCRSFCNAIRGDPLLWRSIHVHQPFNEMITDETLVKLTSRAQGTLQCLSLVDCRKITDFGLKCVLESNPRLTKLSVPGCIKLSIEGILFNLRALKSAGSLRIKQLRIGGRLGITGEQFEELKFLIGVDNMVQPRAPKPLFYRDGQQYLPWDDDRAIDIEMCPRCQHLRLVYDCPAESCVNAAQLCRACRLCITRCIQCGCCIENRDYEEMFCLGNRCMDCKREEKPEMLSAFHQETSYQLSFYG